MWLTRPYQPKPEARQWYEKGMAAMRSMTYDSARKALEQAVKADPQFALAHANLARAYEELDYSDLAKESMLRAVSLAQEVGLSSTDELRLRAARLMVSRDYDRAAETLSRIERIVPATEKASAVLEFARAEYLAGHGDAAEQAFQRAVSLDPSSAAAKMQLAVSLGARGKGGVDRAIKAQQEAKDLFAAASNYEGMAQTLYNQARLLGNSSRPEDALKVIDEALGVTAATGDSFREVNLRFLQASVLSNLGQTDKALAVANQTIEIAQRKGLESAASLGLIDLANVFFVRGDSEPAEKYFRRALEGAERNRNRRSEARARLALGSFLAFSRRKAEAVKQIESALPYFRQSGFQRELTQAGVLLAGIFESSAEYSKAERTARESVAAADQQQDKDLAGQAHQALGSVLVARGDFPSGLKEYETMAVLQTSGPGGAYAKLSVGMIKWRLGRSEEAKRAFNDAAQLIGAVQGSQNRLRARLAHRRAELAYDQGRYLETIEFAKAAQMAAGSRTAFEAIGGQLLEGLAQIRLRQVMSGAALSKGAIDLFAGQRDEEGRLAASRLLTANALWHAGQNGEALELAEAARPLLEKEEIWEPLWQCQWLMAAASGTPFQTAAATLKKLRDRWPDDAFRGYTSRFREEISRFNGVFQ